MPLTDPYVHAPLSRRFNREGDLFVTCAKVCTILVILV